MNDDLCQNFDLLRMHLPDELTEKAKLNFNDDSDFKNYCPNGSCNTDLEKITAGFLWLLGQYFTKYSKKGHIVNDIKPFFLYIILWLSYKLNQNSEHKTNQINDFYTNHVINSGKYNSFTSAAYKFTDLKEFIDGQKDLFNINIKDLSKFYDASKLICSMYGKVAQNKTSDTLSNAASFVNKYTTLNNDCNIKAIKATQNATKGSKQASETISVTNSVKTSAQTFEVTSSSSSIGNKLFTVLSIFGAIAFFLGISYKYSLFGRRKRSQKQYLREKIKNIKKRMNH